jgi:peptidoglycan hydrolase-like protein with peptidoglycan-binding domain
MKRNLALTAATIVPAAVLTVLAVTGASAAMTAAATPAHVTAPKPVIVINPCVFQTLGPSSTYQTCVDDLQVLLNDLWRIGYRGPDQLLATDGYYGPRTASDVASFNATWGLSGGSVATPDTWAGLCVADNSSGFHGAYWHNADCALDV